MSTVNIATHLKQMAQRQPEQTAVMLPAGREKDGGVRYQCLTYQQLDCLSDAIAARLVSHGIERGMRTVLMVPPSLEFFATTFALFKVGAISVFVDPGMGVKNIGKCLAEAEPVGFVGITKAHFARRLMGWGKQSLRKLVAVGRDASVCRWLGRNTAIWDVADLLTHLSPESSFPMVEPPADETAAILFTSGSTGVPKGAVYSHGNFSAQIEMLRTAFQIQPGEIDLCTFPLFALFAPALGMTAVVPRMDFTRPASVDPVEIATPIARHGVANLFGSPALLNRVGRAYEGTACWPSLRRVLSAGAPVSPEIVERFVQRLPAGVQVMTPYGATESLPVAIIGSDEILSETRHITARGGGTCVGRPVAGMEIRIIRISDEPIPEWSDVLLSPPGEIGEIVVSGLNVTQQYFRRDDLTALAKIYDPAIGRMRHRMGDVGYLDSQGRLWFCGRKSQRVISANRTYFTEPAEGIFNAHPDVFRTALVGVRLNGQIEPVLCVETEAARAGLRTGSPQKLTESLLELGARFEETRDIRTILYHPAFPVDIRHNSKIFREKLAVWAAGKLRR
jgi:acyl-CoA synthetase (AMP-forming)/AMP-acid ligase II